MAVRHKRISLPYRCGWQARARGPGNPFVPHSLRHSVDLPLADARSASPSFHSAVTASTEHSAFESPIRLALSSGFNPPESGGPATVDLLSTTNPPTLGVSSSPSRVLTRFATSKQLPDEVSVAWS